MPAIEITAVLTNGEAIMLLAPEGGGAEDGYWLPRFPLRDDDDGIEEALAAHLNRSNGIVVTEQEFVETVYGRLPDGGVVLNNVQLVTAWEGEPLGLAGAPVPVWVPHEFVHELDLPDELRSVVLAALGIASATGQEAAPPELPGAVLIMTGPAGAGKSTVARMLAGRRDRCALIGLDELWHLVVSGAPVPVWRGGDPEATWPHGLLALHNAASLARNFAVAGIDAIIEGVLERPGELDALLDGLAGISVSFVTLVPELAELLRRDASRLPEQRMGERSRALHAIFTSNAEFRGLRMDTTGLSAEETADLIEERLDDARVAL